MKKKKEYGPKLIIEDVTKLKKCNKQHPLCGGDMYFTDKWAHSNSAKRLRWCVKCNGYVYRTVKRRK